MCVIAFSLNTLFPGYASECSQYVQNRNREVTRRGIENDQSWLPQLATKARLPT
ncbi:hypothetical protein J6590_067140 [Homalodisca vitripennis]|nr:hypothetical protein J6590_067140 [Homalodisca vitripennis]